MTAPPVSVGCDHGVHGGAVADRLHVRRVTARVSCRPRALAGGAGAVLALGQGAGLVMSLVAPIVAGRFRDQRAVTAALLVVNVVGFVGLFTTNVWLALWVVRVRLAARLDQPRPAGHGAAQHLWRTDQPGVGDGSKCRLRGCRDRAGRHRRTARSDRIVDVAITALAVAPVPQVASSALAARNATVT